jgi:hydrogenase nickel incorporation protein HypA/HybF
MHELALSQQIVRAALEAGGAEPGQVTAVCVRVGALSGVNVETLRFCLRATCDERGLSRADLRLEPVAALLRCECGAEYEADDVFIACPACGGFVREIAAGMDVSLEYVEVEDE